jgi:hypothetical protein
MVMPMSDDPGVMGNLPRSRPGRRSSKRDGSTGDSTARTTTQASASAAAAKTESTGAKSAAGRSTARKPAAKRATGKRTATAGSTSATSRGRASASAGQRKPAAASAEQPPPRQEKATHGSTDPITGAVLLAGKVVEGGLKVAGASRQLRARGRAGPLRHSLSSLPPASRPAATWRSTRRDRHSCANACG